MAKTWQIPLIAEDSIHPDNGTVIDKKGTLLHYPEAWRYTGETETRTRPVYAWGPNGHRPSISEMETFECAIRVKNIEWIDADYEFSARLKLDSSIHSGRSAKYVHWVHDDGREFPMFVAELVELVTTGDVEQGGFLEEKFGVAKRGKNYGIKYLGKS